MTFNAAERHRSQALALQILVVLGSTPMSQVDALVRREGRGASAGFCHERQNTKLF